MQDNLQSLHISGQLHTDPAHLLIYATDASAYREIPLAVAYPKDNEDIQKIIRFAKEHKNGIIPRAAGTSLAGQVVGNGIVVDVSKYLTRILETNPHEKWVRVQPGVVLDELNLYVKKYGLFFGPETSTSNRCMIGGMVGNNACGAHSIIYGSTRDHLLEVKGFLSDGSEVTLKELSKDEFEEKCTLKSLEGAIYRHIKEKLSDDKNKKELFENYPHPELKRRNTGYALDLLLRNNIFGDSEDKFNFCKLIAGSEGTLLFITEIKLNLVPLPPKEKALVCVHCHDLEEALLGNLVALKFNPGSIELIDDIILECTKENIEQRKNRFFIKGNPGAILIIEFARDSKEEITSIRAELEETMRAAGFGYHFPIITGTDINKVWALRKAALGLLSNVSGDAKPVSLVEDTAVYPEQLPAYIAEFKNMLKTYGLTAVFHAHIATGELHLRPVLNLKDPEHLKLFRKIATETAHLVKKYRGSLSGEHGDGRLRGEFIPIIIGEHNANLCFELKKTWDPKFVFNPGKIVQTPPMDTSLRYSPETREKEIRTYFDFSDSGGILRHTERCNGSGDCRKSAVIGGTMCPSFMATRNEKDVTRARANILREFLTNSNKKNPFDHKEIYEVLDLCISCKGCKSECPSNVDMAKLKAEFLQHFYDSNGVPIRAWLIANIASIERLGSRVSKVYNFFLINKFFSSIIKKVLGFSEHRAIPTIAKLSFEKWIEKNLSALNSSIQSEKEIYLFADEFTNFHDVEIGISTVSLLNKLGVKVEVISGMVSGRTYISKGLLKKAKKIASGNVQKLKNLVNEDRPLIGIEPSAIFTFRDEYPDLVEKELRSDAVFLGKNALSIDEYLATLVDKAEISPDIFTENEQLILLHGHCQQKSISSTIYLKRLLTLPKNYKVEEIPSGCCGMAGSFGYEKEHYELSQKIGELVLFPAVRKAEEKTIICAPGTSCRQHIKDATGKSVLHPVEILLGALK